MHRTQTNRRQIVALSLVLVATGFVAVQPVRAQDPAPSANRYRVLVPILERKGGVPADFGKKTSAAVAKLVATLPTHTPVENKELKDALRKYKLKEEDLDCIKERQLAVQINAELVMCGSYEPAAGGGYTVAAQFISAKTGETFEVQPFAATDPQVAAQHIYQSFENYVRQISLAAYCSDYLASSQWDKALENCNNALAINATSQVALMGKGMALYRMGMAADQSAVTDSARLAEAAETYKKVLEVNPVSQDALKQQGIIAARLGQAELSRQAFKQYMELNPGDAAVRLAIASEASKNGDPEGALRIIEEGLANDTANIDLNTYAGHFAISAASKAAPDSAKPFFETAIKYYGRVYIAKGTETDPGVLQNYILALLQPGIDRKAEAMDIATKAVAAKGNEAGVWAAYANALQANNRLNDALAALDTTLVRDPKFPRLSLRRAQWLLDAGRLNDAVPAFRVAVEKAELDNDQAVALLFRPGFEKYRDNNFDAALDYFAAARELASTSKGKGMANFWSGMVYYQRGIPVAKPQTVKAARAALPIFQRALNYLQGEGVDDYANATRGVNLGQTISAVKQYIEIQNTIIKRG